MSDLYLQGGAIIDGVLAQRGSLKGLVMQTAKRERSDAKRLLALTANTLAYKKALESVLERSDMLKVERKTIRAASKGKCSDTSLTLVLVHDLLLTKRGRIATSPAWPPHASITRHAARLRSELVKVQIQLGKSSVEGLRAGGEAKERADRIPRWIRINQRLTSLEDVKAKLLDQGWKEVHRASDLTATQKTFCASQFVENVIAVHNSHTRIFTQHELYRTGHIILQDLASCFPAAILLNNAQGKIHALDATAAPGNKTSHLSALLSSGGMGSYVTAFEHSRPRYEVLRKQLDRAGALQQDSSGYVRTIHGDFTRQDPEKYADVSHMLLDPSCSGSGILGRLDYLTSSEEESGSDVLQTDEQEVAGKEESTHDKRLQGLSSFQSAMLDRAMHFPGLRKLVYSTCSIHHEENEDVVMKALSSEVAEERGWKLAERSEVIPDWKERGLIEHCKNDKTLAGGMIRCTPGGNEDAVTSGVSMEATNGFFLACFVREHDSVVSEQTAALGDNTLKNRKRKLRAKEKAREEKRSRSENVR
jgi:putative methyltransferase